VESQRQRPSERPGRLRIGIISAGRVGAALGSALRAEGHDVVAAYASSEASVDRLEAMLPGVPARSVPEIVEASQLVILAVPDDELVGIVNGVAQLALWRPGMIVLHVAGSRGVSVLASAAQAGAIAIAAHPAMTFTGTSLDVARLVGCPFAVTCAPVYLPIAEALVSEMGGVPYAVAEENRGLYHAALAHGANHLVTLVAQAMRALEAAGVDNPGAFLTPLLEASLDGVLRSGETLLTGPVVRGDVGTVTRHCEAFDALALGAEYADIPPVYRALAEATARRAYARRVISKTTADELIEALRTAD
jgi:predicted short-subunit dehydrogenase-like oxidoreductase (DUF2520 family)